MMNGTAGSFLAGQFAISAATSERVSTSNAEGGEAGTYGFKAGKVFKLISARGVKNLNELFQEINYDNYFIFIKDQVYEVIFYRYGI